MKIVKKSFLSLMSCLTILVINGCAAKTEVTPPVIIKPAECIAPEKPDAFIKFNELDHIGGSNIYLLKKNLIDIKMYIKNLESTIQCYKNQSEKK